MKFIAIKCIFILIIQCSIFSSRKINNKINSHQIYELENKDDGGSWETHYNCPKIFLSDDKNTLIDLGEGKIMAQKMSTPVKSTTDGKNGYDDVGFIFEFKKKPDNPDIIKQLHMLSADTNKYMLNYRYFYIEGFHEEEKTIKFESPSGENKFLQGKYRFNSNSLRSMKIILPYKHGLGSFISEKNGEELAQNIRHHVRIQARRVADAKSRILTNLDSIIALGKDEKNKDYINKNKKDIQKEFKELYFYAPESNTDINKAKEACEKNNVKDVRSNFDLILPK